MIDTLMQYKFLQNAVISAILASIACGIIGGHYRKRLVMMSGALPIQHLAGLALVFIGIGP